MRTYALSPLALLTLALATAPASAAALCGRLQEAPEALFERLSKVEKLAEIHRDKAYVALHDRTRETTWTFTVPGHPAHPSAVCRRPVQDGDRVRLEMHVSCGAPEAECEQLVQAFQELNQRMLEELERQKK